MFDILGLMALILAASTSVGAEAAKTTATPEAVEALSATGRIAFKWHTISLVGTVPANGDSDQYADTDETLDITLTLVNKTGLELTDFVATLTTPNTDVIECIDPYQVTIPSIAAGATFTTPAFRFKVGNASAVNRTTVAQILEATFDVAIRTAQFEVLDRPMRFTLPLDLDASPNGGLGTWSEDFEAGFGNFSEQTLDAGKNSLAASDGMRCQYNDPDIPGGISAGNVNCYLGFPADTAAGVNDWHVHDSSSANGGVGRAYTGSKSLHWGVHLGATPKRDTTRFKQLDAVRSGQMNIPAASLHPELYFAHQVSLMRHGYGGIDGPVDRAVVQVNVINAFGWKTVEPYVNRYDQRPYNFYSSCTFDPTDDGNDEDDLYPGQAGYYVTGPSSTCYPQFIFSNLGDTDYQLPADPARIGGASDGPGLTGSIDVGTWVESRFNLQEFAGRSIRIRFLATSIEVGSGLQTWDDFFHVDDLVADDGWYIDTVRVSPAASLAYTIAADTKAITALPCVPCTSIQTALVATPNVLPEPGGVVTLDASAIVDHCKHSPPQYEFWVDENVNGVTGDAGDTLLRAAADEPTFVFTPDQTEQYAVVTSCRGEPTCDAADGSNTAAAPVTVNCPPGIDRTAFGQTIRLWGADEGAYTFVSIEWTVEKPVDVIRGCLTGTPSLPATGCLHESGSFTGSLDSCVLSNNFARNYAQDFAPDAGSYFYLVRGQVATCGTSGPGYTNHAPSERPGRDTEIDADSVAAACP